MVFDSVTRRFESFWPCHAKYIRLDENLSVFILYIERSPRKWIHTEVCNNTIDYINDFYSTVDRYIKSINKYIIPYVKEINYLDPIAKKIKEL